MADLEPDVPCWVMPTRPCVEWRDPDGTVITDQHPPIERIKQAREVQIAEPCESLCWRYKHTREVREL